jgi:hypothetical protein
MTIRVFKASWGRGISMVTHADELRALMDRIRSLGEPTMLFLEAASGPTLVLGLGASESVLTFVERGGVSFHSVGDQARRGYLKFRCRDTVDDFHAEMAVPESRAIDAAFEFLKAAPSKPTSVAWEADQ